MKQILTILILMLLFNPLFGQKHLDVPKTQAIGSFIEKLPQNLEKLELKDLRTSKDSLNIRIWQTHEVFTLNRDYDSTLSDYKIYTANKELVFKSFNFAENISQNILDSLLDAKIMTLKNENYRGIDGSLVFIEISTKSNYKVISYWSPNLERSNDCKTVVQILDMLDNSIDSKKLKNNFLNSLPSGNYRWGITSIRIDRFLNKDITKSNFYSQAEEKIRMELHITDKTNHWDYPLILIDNKPANISDLNKYKNKQVSNFEVIKTDNDLIAIYGTSGSNGVIIIETK